MRAINFLIFFIFINGCTTIEVAEVFTKTSIKVVEGVSSKSTDIIDNEENQKEEGLTNLPDTKKEISKEKKISKATANKQRKISNLKLLGKSLNDLSKEIGDPILIREDNSLLYHLPSVVDDINEGITDIIRGEDHVNNTAFHLQLFESLGSNPPNFGHHPLLTDLQGKGLGKRLGSISVQDIKNEGFEAITIINYLLTIGTSKNISSEINIQNLIKNFEIKDLARSSPKFNKANLISINADIIKKYDFKIANGKLKEIGIINANNSFWNFIKNNINFIKESIEWWNIVSKKNVFYENDKEFLSMCASVLPDEPYSSNSWDEWLDNIKKISSRKGKELFKPLRLALTGKENGPELKYLIPLLTRKIILHRLNNKS